MDAEEVQEGLHFGLIEMQCDNILKSRNQLLTLLNFYQSLDDEKFPLTRRHADRIMSFLVQHFLS